MNNNYTFDKVSVWRLTRNHIKVTDVLERTCPSCLMTLRVMVEAPEYLSSLASCVCQITPSSRVENIQNIKCPKAVCFDLGYFPESQQRHKSLQKNECSSEGRKSSSTLLHMTVISSSFHFAPQDRQAQAGRILVQLPKPQAQVWRASNSQPSLSSSLLFDYTKSKGRERARQDEQMTAPFRWGQRMRGCSPRSSSIREHRELPRASRSFPELLSDCQVHFSRVHRVSPALYGPDIPQFHAA